jgi:hypothetical protein
MEREGSRKGYEDWAKEKEGRRERKRTARIGRFTGEDCGAGREEKQAERAIPRWARDEKDVYRG